MSMRKTSTQHSIGTLAALLLAAVFAVSILVVLLTGGKVYRSLTLRDQAAFERRTCVQYVATQARAWDTAGGWAVEDDFGGVSALVLGPGEEYITRVYCYGGYLMELYCAADEDMMPEDGERVLELEGLSFRLENGLLTADFIDTDGSRQSLLLAGRNEGVGE